MAGNLAKKIPQGCGVNLIIEEDRLTLAISTGSATGKKKKSQRLILLLGHPRGMTTH